MDDLSKRVFSKRSAASLASLGKTMDRKQIFAAATSLLTLICLAACGEEPTSSPQAGNVSTLAANATGPAASGTPKATPTPLPPLAEGLIDISGCWRSIGTDGYASGNQVDILRTDADAFVFAGGPLRTKLVFTPAHSFSEINYDDSHPFFPKGYVHSTGIVTDDGNTLSRTIIADESKPQTLKRCGTISERPFAPIVNDLPHPSASVLIDGGGGPDATPTPFKFGNPTISPTASPAESTSPEASVSPSAKPTATATPKPSPTPTTKPSVTPKPTATPKPSVSPYVSPTPLPSSPA